MSIEEERAVKDELLGEKAEVSAERCRQEASKRQLYKYQNIQISLQQATYVSYFYLMNHLKQWSL